MKKKMCMKESIMRRTLLRIEKKKKRDKRGGGE